VIHCDHRDGWYDNCPRCKGRIERRSNDNREDKSLSQPHEPMSLVSSTQTEEKGGTYLNLTVMTPFAPKSNVIPARVFSVTLLSPLTYVENVPVEVTAPPTLTLTPPNTVLP
jgi:hypothetical protein